MSTYLEQTYTQNEIQEFISSQKEESINLEFKRSDSLKITDSCKNEIAKDVSAFANSDGGIVIYGIVEQNHQAFDFSFIDGNSITKEWLDQVINSRIQRRIDGLVIDVIRFNNLIDKSIYVVKIPRSFNAPHMSSNKKYYKRHNFESIEMEEYEVRDLYYRHSFTKLKICDPIINVVQRSTVGLKYRELGMMVRIDIENISNLIEKDFKLEIRIPRQIALVSSAHGPLFPGPIRNEDDYTVYSLPNHSPVFQEEVSTIGTINLCISKRTYNDFMDKNIQLTLFYTDGIEKKQLVLADYMKLNNNPIQFQDFD
jgi:hypothetical protein